MKVGKKGFFSVSVWLSFCQTGQETLNNKVFVEFFFLLGWVSRKSNNKPKNKNTQTTPPKQKLKRKG